MGQGAEVQLVGAGRGGSKLSLQVVGAAASIKLIEATCEHFQGMCCVTPFHSLNPYLLVSQNFRDHDTGAVRPKCMFSAEPHLG